MIHPRYDGRMSDRRAGLDLAPGEVVLDWKGTVVADRSRAVGATNAVLAAHGLPPITDADFGRLFGLPLRRFLSRLSCRPARWLTPRRPGTYRARRARQNSRMAPWRSLWSASG